MNKSNSPRKQLPTHKSKKGKKKKANTLSKVLLGTSLVNTKIPVTYFKTSCGTVECVEKDDISSCAQLNAFSSSNSSRDLKRLVKPTKNCVKIDRPKVEYCNVTALHPKKSIVKMDKIISDENCGNAILQNCSEIRKNNCADLSLLESLVLTGRSSDGNKPTISESETVASTVQTKFSALSKRRTSYQHSPYQNIKSALTCDTIEVKNNIKLNCDKTTNNYFTNSPTCSITTNIGGKNSATHFYQLGCSKFLVVMKPGSNICLIGTAEIHLLKGKVEILGYTSCKENDELLIFSLQGSCHLHLHATEGNGSFLSDNNSDKSLFKEFISLGLSETLSNKIAKKSENSVLFTISRNKSDVSSTVWPTFFENHSSFFVFPPINLLNNISRPCHYVERKINCLFETNVQELGFKEFIEIDEWPMIERCFIEQDSPKAVLTGGKSVGKSTFLRHLINKSLSKWEQILVLDFDLGQCEFTVPGCISATLVGEPLLGPNYTHLKKPKRSVFLGEVDVTKCPENYIEGCKYLINYAKKKHGHIPWVINTMGFTKGFGVSLACGIINYANPTQVVQIQSKDGKLNFPSLLEPKFVNYQKHSAFETEGNITDYELYVIPSGPEQQGGFASKSRGISPPESRNLVILSYMSKMLNANMSSLSQVTPYMISMERIDLQTTDKYNLTKAQIAAAMNGNMVALCHNRPFITFRNCLGFGIVRAIDWQSGTIFLITPLLENELSRVNCLVKGNVGLPDSLYYNQGDQVKGHVPYVAYTSNRSTARFAKRDFRNFPVTPRARRKY